MNLAIQILTLATAIVVLLQSMMSAHKVRGKVEEVHELVNGAHTQVVARVAQLETTLDESGVPIPPTTTVGE